MEHILDNTGQQEDIFKHELAPPSPDLGIENQKETETVIAANQDIDTALSLSNNLEWSLKTALNVDPKVARLASELKKRGGRLSYDFIERNKNHLEQYVELKGVLNLLNSEDDKGRPLYPYTRAWLSNPQRASRTKNSAQTLAKLEGLFLKEYGSWYEKTGSALLEGTREVARSAVGAAALLSRFAPIGVGPGLQYYADASKAIGNKKMADTFEALPKFLETITQSELLTPIPNLTTGFEGWVYDVIRQVPQLAATLLAGGVAAKGLGLGAKVLAGTTFMGTQIAGGDYAAFVEQGSSPQEAAIAGLSDALLQAPLEYIKIGSLLKMSGLDKTAVRQIAKKILTYAGEGFMSEFLQSYPEQAAQLWIRSDNGERSYSERVDWFFDQYTKEFGETTIQGLYEGSIGLVMEAGFGAYAIKNYMSRAADHKKKINFTNRLANTIQGDPSLTQDPDAAESFVRPLAKENGIDNVYIDLTDFYALFENEEDPDAAQEEFIRDKEIEEEYTKALETGEPITIPYEKYVAKISAKDLGKELEKIISFTPFGDTIQTLQTEDDNGKLRKVFEEASRRYKEIVGEVGVPDHIKKMREVLVDKKGGGFSSNEADAYMAFYLALAKRSATMEGLGLNEWLDKYNPQIIVDSKGVHVISDNPDAKGAFSIIEGSPTISLFKKKTKTTFLHEAFHMFTVMMGDYLNNAEDVGQERLAKDYLALVHAAGGKLDQKGHEKLVNKFLTYLKTAKAPTPELVEPFRMFKGWLSTELKTKDVEVSDELKQVFERMMASDFEIELMKGIEEDVLDSIKEISPQDKARVKKAEGRAKEKAKEDLTSKRLKALEKAIGGKRAIKEKAKGDVEAQRVYKAIEKIKEMGGINEADVAEKWGEDNIEPFKKHKRLIKKKKGIPLEQAATEAGYEDVDTMLLEIADAETKNNAVKQRAKEISREFEQKIFNDFTPEEVAHNDTTLEVLIAKIALLTKSVNKTEGRRTRQARKAIILQAAKNTLADMPASKAKLYKGIIRQEESLAKKAVSEAKKGNNEKALKHLTQQAYYHAMAVEAIKIEKAINKTIKSWQFKNLNKRLKNVEEEYKEAVLQLTKRYTLNDSKTQAQPKEEYKKANKLKLPGDRKAMLESFIPDWIISLQTPENYTKPTDLTWRQFQELSNTVDGLIKAGRDLALGIQAIKNKKISEVINSLVTNANETMGKATQGKIRNLLKTVFGLGKYDPNTKGGKAQQKMATALNSLTEAVMLAEAFDGFPTLQGKAQGLLRTLVQEGIAADSKEANLMMEIGAKMHKPGMVLVDAKQRIHKDRILQNITAPVPEIIQKRYNRNKWTFEMAVMVAMNTGTEHNYTVLTEAYGLERQHIEDIMGIFTAEELKALEDIRDLVGSNWDEAERVSYNINLQKPRKEKAVGFEFVNKYGENIKLKGGYFPIIFDPKLSTKASRNVQQAEALKLTDQLLGNLWAPIKAEDYMAKERLKTADGKPVVIRPILLNTIAITKAIRASTHFVTHAEYLDTMNRIIRDSKFKTAFVDKMGDEAYKAFLQAYTYQARPDAEYAGVWDLPKLRAFSTFAFLGNKIRTALKARLSMWQGFQSLADRIGYLKAIKYYYQGIHKAGIRGTVGFQKAKAVRNVYDLSNYMKQRPRNMGERDVQDIINSFKPFMKTWTLPNGTRFTKQDLLDFSMFLWRINDTGAVIPTWYAAYDMALSEGLAKDDKEAIKFADSIVQESQPSALPLEQNYVQRQRGLLRVFTPFMTFRFKLGNRFLNHIRAYVDDKITAKKLAGYMMVDFMANRYTLLLAAYMLYDDEHDPEWWEWLVGPAEEMVSWIPYASNITSGLRSSVKTSGYDTDRGFVPPAFEGMKRGVKTAGKFKKAITKNTWDLWGDFLWSLYRTVEFHGLPPASNIIQDFKQIKKQMGAR